MILDKFQSRQLILTFVYISFLHVKVLHATWRPWEGRKSGRKCGEVDENMSEHGTTIKQPLLYAMFSQYWYLCVKGFDS